jgi:GNAT superfamily N-acetyltransferase
MTGARDDHRISLLPFDTCDPSDEIAWLPEAWAAIDGRKLDASAPSAVGNLAEAARLRWVDTHIDRIEVLPHGFAGVIIWEAKQLEMVIRGLAIRRDLRNLGYGAEAVERLEAWWPGHRFATAIPRFNGLAVYFWLRVGFRPFRDEEDRARTRDPDFLWMLRSAPPGASAAMSDP